MSSSPVLRQTPRPVRISIAIAWAGWLLLFALYWVQLLTSHTGQLHDAEQQARLRAHETAHALALQVDTQFRKLNLIIEHLERAWVHEGQHGLARAVDQSVASMPPGALAGVTLADASGRVVYSSFRTRDGHLPSPSIADWNYFQVHQERAAPSLFVAAPEFEATSGHWVVPLSRPVIEQGSLKAVIILAVSAEYLSQAFQEIFPDRDDVAVLIRADGRYLARSQDLDGVLGTSVPAEREFLRVADKQQGVYEATADIDGIRRFYAWHRISGFPLILSVGLGKDKVLGPVARALDQSRLHNLAGSLLLMLAAGWITRLVLIRAVQTQRLVEAEERLRQAVDAVRDGLWSWDLADGQMSWDRRCHEILGLPDGALPRPFLAWSELLHPNDRADTVHTLQSHTRGAGDGVTVECRLRGAAGRYHWVELRGRMLAGPEDGTPGRLIGTCTDIGPRVAEAQLRRALLDQSAAAIILASPERRVIHASARAVDLFAAPGESLDGADLRRIHVDEDSFQGLRDHYAHVRRQGTVRLEYPLLTYSQDVRWFDMHATACDPDDPHSNVIWTLIDVTERHVAEETLSTLANTDPLTGLHNRRSFMARLDAHLRQRDANQPAGGLLMLDVDHFKRINDTFGHPAGDLVLQHIARLMQDCIRKEDMVGRLGGEEFAVLVPHADAGACHALAERLRANIAWTPTANQGQPIAATVSIGLTALAGLDAREALRRADEALYAAKGAGRNRVCLAEPVCPLALTAPGA